MKLYLSTVNTYWECGDEHANDEMVIGIFSDPDKAHDAGIEFIWKNYKHDPETDTYYGDFADEAWVSVIEYELDSAECRGLMIKDEGVWHNRTRELEKAAKNAQNHSDRENA